MDRHQPRLPKANYYKGNSANRSETPFRRRSTSTTPSRVAKLVDTLIVATILSGLIYSLIVSPNPVVLADSHSYHPASVYQAAARSRMSALKDRTKITFDEGSIIADLQRQYPEISSASIELPMFSQKPTLRLSISKPAFVFTGTGGAYIVDSDGVAVAPVANLPPQKNLLTIEDQSGYKVSAGTHILSADSVNFVNAVVGQARRAGVPVASLILPAAAQELDLKTTDKAYLVKFYLGGDANVQAGQFLAARHQFSASHQDPGSYLDVRVSGKIFYK